MKKRLILKELSLDLLIAVVAGITVGTAYPRL